MQNYKKNAVFKFQLKKIKCEKYRKNLKILKYINNI